MSPLVERRHLSEDDLAHLAFVQEVFLPELAAHGVISEDQSHRARNVVRELNGEAREPVPSPRDAREVSFVESRIDRTAATPTAVLGAASPTPSTSLPLQVPPVATGVPVATTETGWQVVDREATAPAWQPPEPGPFSRWMDRTWESIRSDLAVHGLAYLGVLLFFVGAFGLVAFAFGDVQRELRPAAEIVIAAVPFAAAALLIRRGALIVGRALEVSGGLLLPVMVVTSFLDGVGVPPDLTGTALVLALTSACVALTLGYALWARSHPESALRYLVAPMAWFTVAMASLGVGRAIPSGEQVAVPGSAQIALTLAALAASTLWARRTPEAQLALPTCIAAVPGLVILALLALLTWVREPDASALSVGGAGLAGLAALELLAGPEPPANRLGGTTIGLIAPLWWGATILALAGPLGQEWAAALGAVGYVAILELAGRTGRPDWALALPAAGVLGSAAATLGQPGITAGLLALLSGWAMLRRRSPFPVPAAQESLDVASAVLPVGSVAALAAAWSPSATLLLGSALVLVLAVLSGRAEDTFWPMTWRVWLALAAAAALAWSASHAWPTPGTAPATEWMAAGAVALLATASLVGPLPSTLRPWTTIAFGAWAWILSCALAGIPDIVRGLVLAAVALGLVAFAHLDSRRDRPDAASLGLTGHVLAACAIALGGWGWGLAGSLALFTVGSWMTAVADARGRSPVGRFLRRIGRSAAYLPPVLSALGMAGTAVATLHAADPESGLDWASLTLAGVCVAMAAAVRGGMPTRISETFAWAAFLLPGAAAALAVDAPGLIPPLVGLMVAVAVLPADRRWPGMTWTAWAALAPLVGLVAVEVSDAFAANASDWQAALVLCCVGSAMLLAAAVADLPAGPWRPHWRPRLSALNPVAALGAAEAVGGGALLLPYATDPTTGWILLGMAAVTLATGLLARVGVLGGMSVVMAWAASLVLVDPVTVPPVLGVVGAAVLLGLADALHQHLDADPWWSRWGIPLALSATPIAAASVLSAVGTPDEPITSAAAGTLALLASARLRAIPPLSVASALLGVVLVLSGANAAGPWWLAAVLTALAVGLTGAATRTEGAVQSRLQVSGAFTAGLAWWAVVAAAGWPAARVADLTAVGAGAITVGTATAARLRREARSWAIVWGGMSAVLVAIIATASWKGAATLQPSIAIVAGMAMATVSFFLAAAPLRVRLLSDLGSLGIVATLLTAMEVADAATTPRVLILVGLSAACGLATLQARGSLQHNAIVLGVLAATAAAGYALWPELTPSLLIACLAVGSLQAAAVGSALRSLPIQMLSPVLACGAWLVFAADSLAGEVQWWTAPIGFTLLVLVGMWRRDRIRRGEPIASAEIVGVEATGVALLVGASLVQMVTVSLVNVIPALLLGSGIAAWGVITRVRRRLAMGMAVVLAAAILLVAVPLVDLLPQWEGAALWVLIASMGVVAMLAATLLEQGRAAARAAKGRFSDLTQGWE